VTRTATGLGSALNAKGFIPYVHGATQGRPSKGRPEKVLAAKRDKPVLPPALAAVPDGPPERPGARRTAERAGHECMVHLPETGRRP